MLHLPLAASLLGLAGSAAVGVAAAVTLTVAAVPSTVNHAPTPTGPSAVYGTR